MIEFLVTHHSAMSRKYNPNQFSIVNGYHRKFKHRSSLGYDIQYTHFIEGNGKVIRGRKDLDFGWHCGNWKINKSSLSVCLAGNMMTETVSDAQDASLRRLAQETIAKYPQIKIVGHRDCVATLCPGKNITKEYLNNLTNTMKLFIDGNNNQVIGDETFQFGVSIPNPEKLAEIKEHCKKTGNELKEPEKNEMVGWYLVRGTNALGWKNFLNL